MQNFDLLVFLKDWGPVSLTLIAVISSILSVIILGYTTFSISARKKVQVDLADKYQKLAADTLELTEKADARYEKTRVKMEASIAALEKKVAQLENIIALLGEDKVNLLAKIEILNKVQEDMKKTIATLQHEKGLLETKNTALEDRVKKLEAYLKEKGLPLPNGNGDHG